VATQKVSSNYARARSGRPPTGAVHDAHKAGQTPGFRQPAKAAPEKSHVASKATRTALRSVAPESRTVVRKSPKTRTLKLPKADQRSTSFIKRAGNHSPALAAEFIIGLLIIVMSTVSNTAKSDYQSAMAKAMLQGSAFIAVFFVLFLMAAGKRGSEAAAWFGALVDLGILFTAVNGNAIQDFSDLVQGKGITDAQLLSATKVDEYYQTSAEWQDETPNAVTV
jgi:hypothetical protein